MALSLLFASQKTNQGQINCKEPTNMSAGEANCAAVDGGLRPNGHHKKQVSAPEFQMPLHYPRYKKPDYEKMPEWQIDSLLREYGLPVAGDAHQKRRFAMGAFLWPEQLK
ncbi:hypothetical protein CASFOL_010907 [Castilleja foliolosa]|uniref:DUF7722 domain-containing protein n=1 Tax=Castilleja foliolosa TaxID=1961234 RepID=A0ABD3DVV2_9LAMI